MTPKFSRIFLAAILLVNCNLFSFQNINVTNPKVGIEIDKDGYLVHDLQIIPSDVEIIYFQFDLDAPDDMEVVLDFKWYHDNNLLLTYSGSHMKGPIAATLRQESETIKNLPEGAYIVEVWLLNTLLIKKFFSIVNK